MATNASPTRVIVLGAGWSGLAAAHTYLTISRLLDRPIALTILDNNADAGGVWSSRRLYPGLVANSPNGLYEFSWMTMVEEGHPWYQLIPGERVRDYLGKVCEKVKGMGAQCKFGVQVARVRRKKGKGSGWVVESKAGEIWECEKLVVSTGLYSKERIPEIDAKGFDGVSLHSGKLGELQQSVRVDEKVTNVVVVGGCKSGVEAVSVFLPDLNPNKKFKVSWVVRPSESGVPLVVQDVDKNANLVAANNTRLFSSISPSIFDTQSWLYWFMQSGRSRIGSFVRNGFWNMLSWAVKKDAKYKTSQNGRAIEPKGNTLFYDLQYVSLLPKKSPFLRWLHMDDEQILKAYRVNPMKLQAREMVVVDADGIESTLPCDAVIWCTGWLPSIDFFDEETADVMGLPKALLAGKSKTMPHQSLNEPPVLKQHQPEHYDDGLSEAARAAEERVIAFFPHFRDRRRPAYAPPYTNFQLYRQIISAETLASKDRSIAFSGLISNGQTAMCSELTSLWSVAWLEDLLPKNVLPKTKEEAEDSIELVNAWMRRRYGMKGAKDPEIVLEIQTFFDVLCQDLGIEVERKKRGGPKRTGPSGWWAAVKAEWTEVATPYVAADYRGVIEEFLTRNGWLDGKAIP